MKQLLPWAAFAVAVVALMFGIASLDVSSRTRQEMIETAFRSAAEKQNKKYVPWYTGGVTRHLIDGEEVAETWGER